MPTTSLERQQSSCALSDEHCLFVRLTVSTSPVNAAVGPGLLVQLRPGASWTLLDVRLDSVDGSSRPSRDPCRH